jgi:hypothetical protein
LFEAGAACALGRAKREGLTFDRWRRGYRILLGRAPSWLWALEPIACEARLDAARLLLGAGRSGPPPLCFRERTRNVYVFATEEPFVLSSHNDGRVWIRGDGDMLDLPERAFEEGVMAALEWGSLENILDTPAHPGLKVFLDRWTRISGWIEAQQ